VLCCRYVAVVQLVKRKADLESEVDIKLKDLHDSHDQEHQRLTSELEVKKQKLHDDFQQYVSPADLLAFQQGILLSCHYVTLQPFVTLTSEAFSVFNCLAEQFCTVSLSVMIAVLSFVLSIMAHPP